MARLLLVRHGQSSWNAESRWQGWADPPLSELGEAQAAALAERLARWRFDGVVSSDLERARRTASIAARSLGLPVEVEPALREREVGSWQGLTTSEIEEGWPDSLVAWRSGALPAPPGGEHNDAMAHRVLGALSRLVARPEGALLVVTHGGVVRMTQRRLGLQASRTPNLSGRWVEGAPGGEGWDGLRAGPEFAGPEVDDDGRPSTVSPQVPGGGFSDEELAGE